MGKDILFLFSETAIRNALIRIILKSGLVENEGNDWENSKRRWKIPAEGGKESRRLSRGCGLRENTTFSGSKLAFWTQDRRAKLADMRLKGVDNTMSKMRKK